MRESVQKRQGQESGGFLPLLLCFAVFGKTEYAVCCSAKRGHADRKKPPEGGIFGNILPQKTGQAVNDRMDRKSDRIIG